MNKHETKRIVGFSGGADSQAVALWVRQRFPAEEIILLNSDAGGNEHPITTEFIKGYSETIFPVITISPLIGDLAGVGTSENGETGKRRREFRDTDMLTYDRLAHIKGRFPGPTSRFCTEYLKLRPQKRWIEEHIIKPNPTVTITRYTGIRRDESRARRNTPDKEWDDFLDCEIYYPVASWTKQQVFEYLRQNGEQVNPLYLMGFNRIGCAPCTCSSKGDIENWARRFPEMIDKVRGWEAAVGRTFFAPCVPGMSINFIDDVVKWSKTERGGKITLELYQMIEPEQCVSKYGLCE